MWFRVGVWKQKVYNGFFLTGMNLFCTCDNIDEQNIQCNKAKQQNNDGTVDPEIE